MVFQYTNTSLYILIINSGTIFLLYFSTISLGYFNLSSSIFYLVSLVGKTLELNIL